MSKTIELKVQVLDDDGNVLSEHVEGATVIESVEDLQELMDSVCYTPCEEYGHRYSFEGQTEVFDNCLDCGEPRCK